MENNHSSLFHGERVASLEARVTQNEQSVSGAWDAIDDIKDRIFNILLVVCGACVTSTATLLWYLIDKTK